MNDTELIALLARTLSALEEEMAEVLDLDDGGPGPPRPVVPRRDEEYYHAVADAAAMLRGLLAMVRARAAAEGRR